MIIRNELIKIFRSSKFIIVCFILLFLTSLKIYSYIGNRNSFKRDIESLSSLESINTTFKEGDLSLFLKNDLSKVYKNHVLEEMDNIKQETLNSKKALGLDALKIESYRRVNFNMVKELSDVKERVLTEFKKNNLENYVNELEYEKLASSIKNDERIKGFNILNSHRIDDSKPNKELSLRFLSEKKKHGDSLIKEYSGISMLLMSLVNLDVFVFLVIVILSYDAIHGEVERGTDKILFTNPMSRSKIILEKYFASIISISVILLSFFLISVIMVTIVFGAFDLNNLVVFDGTSDKILNKAFTTLFAREFMIMPFYKAIILRLVQYVFYIAASTAFVFLFSSVFKSRLTSLIINIVIFSVTITRLSSITSDSKWDIPFNFLFLQSIDPINGFYYRVSGFLFMIQDIRFVSFRATILIYRVLTVIFLSASILIFNRKDLRK